MSPPNQRAIAALTTMRNIGFPESETKPLLKRLLKESDNNWDFIEDGNYSALVDLIFLQRESQPQAQEEVGVTRRSKKMREDPRGGFIKKIPDAGPADDPVVEKEMDEPEPEPLVRYRREKRPMGSEMPDLVPVMKVPKTEPGVEMAGNVGEVEPPPVPLAIIHPNVLPPVILGHGVPSAKEGQVLGQGQLVGNAQNTAVAGQVQGQSVRNAHTSAGGSNNARKDQSVQAELAKSAYTAAGAAATYIREEQVIAQGPSPSNVPVISVALSKRNEQLLGQRPSITSVPTASTVTSNIEDQVSIQEHSARKTSDLVVAPYTQKGHDKGKGILQVAGSSNRTSDVIAHGSQGSSADMVIASSSSGEVKISLTCSRTHPNFQMPSMEYLCKAVEERCLRSYKILQPDFSLMNVMKEMCQAVLEMGDESDPNKSERYVNVNPRLDTVRKFGQNDMPGCSNGPAKLTVAHGSKTPQNNTNPNRNSQNKENGLNGNINNYSRQEATNVPTTSLDVVQQPLLFPGTRPLHDATDISKLEERVRIPVENNGRLPPAFFYIPNNLVRQNAYLNFSLARIGDEDCCADCFGDCLSAPFPCSCTRESGGEFAYNSDGLLKSKFLDECISMVNTPERHELFYCKSCPVERIRNEVSPDSCKGHLIRKFIKECWSKCGCNKLCGNRVVQRGITCNLEVFLTGEKKGWGVRTLDELPRGSFVCEYVGEILTNIELYERTVETTGNARHTYPVLLDADWGTEGVLKDEEALCLDATFYGNVARFINHRCTDANLVEVPVQVETPDRHYYHLAFFTTRKVEALEELTWDYGIDFDDKKHPVKAFTCSCQSKLCRGMKRTRRSAKRSD